MRTSRRIHPSFILAKGRSLGFASASADSWRPVRTRFRFGCAHLLRLTSPATATRRLIMQKARRHPHRGSDRLQAHGFRVCFTPLLEVLFTFPSRYLCAIGLSVVFSLAGWSPLIPAEFLVLRGTQVPPDEPFSISRTGLSPSVAMLSCMFRYASLFILSAVLQPRALPETTPVWAPARSLATTCAIVVTFSSSGY